MKTLHSRLDHILTMINFDRRRVEVLNARLTLEQQVEETTIKAMKVALEIFEETREKLLQDYSDETGEVSDYFDYISFSTMRVIVEACVTTDSAYGRTIAMLLIYSIHVRRDAETFDEFLLRYGGLEVSLAYMATKIDFFSDEGRYAS